MEETLRMRVSQEEYSPRFGLWSKSKDKPYYNKRRIKIYEKNCGDFGGQRELQGAGKSGKMRLL